MQFAHLEKKFRSWVVNGSSNMLHSADKVMPCNERPQAAVGICVEDNHLADDKLLEAGAVLPLGVVVEFVDDVTPWHSTFVSGDSNV